MRSESTMKVSLTPDRLRSMETLKQQEKGKRGKNQGTPISPLRLKPESQKSPPPSSHSRHAPQRTLRHVDSIVEDEEEPVPQNQALRKQSSSSSFPSKPPSASLNNRNRSASSSAQMSNFGSHRTQGNGSQRNNRNNPFDAPDSNSGFPAKTRKVQKNRESLDLDDVMMGGSDDEEADALSLPKTPRSISKRGGTSPNVTSSTRELVDFLNDGPPSTGLPNAGPPGIATPVSKNNRDLIDFLAQGPPEMHEPQPILSPDPKKSSGRLQRMMSKLSLSASDKARSNEDSKQFAGKAITPPMPIAPKPIPPRPRIATPPVSPPPSPSQPSRVLPPPQPSREMPAAAYSSPPTSPPPNKRPRMQSVSRKAVPIEDKPESPLPVPVKKRPAPITTQGSNGDASAPSSKEHIDRRQEQTKDAESSGRHAHVTPPARLSSRSAQATAEANTPVDVPQPAVHQPAISIEAAQDIRRLMSRATNADECRVIFDMFMAKFDIPLTSGDSATPLPNSTDPYPSPSASEEASSDHAIEGSLVELLLSGDRAILPLPKSTSTSPSRSDPAVEQPGDTFESAQDIDSAAPLVVANPTPNGASEVPRSPLPPPSPSPDVMAAMIPPRPIRRKQSRLEPRIDSSAQPHAQLHTPTELAA